MADGGWRMADGEWRMANGEWRKGSSLITRHSRQRQPEGEWR
jgi:hypothetical protein